MQGMRRPLSSVHPDQLAADLRGAGLNPSHALRLLGGFYRSGGRAWRDVRFGPRVVSFIEQAFDERITRIAHRHVAADGTTKLLLNLPDGHAVETVLMPAFRPDRAAGCVSSQVGCAMRCDFCASTRDGLHRNLETGEIVEQFLRLRAEAADDNRRLHSIVFMGMGEPMHNLPAVCEAIRLITHNRLGTISKRSVTVSTVGVVPGIIELANSGLGVHLAISLHAPDDETRGRIIPTNRKWSVGDVVAAGREYQRITGRIVTIEYTLLGGVNDSPEQAELLAERVRGWRVHVNLIPYNPIGPGVTGVVYQKPSRDALARFEQVLIGRGVVTHVRRTRGDDVDAACGQLRLQVLSSR